MKNTQSLPFHLTLGLILFSLLLAACSPAAAELPVADEPAAESPVATRPATEPETADSVGELPPDQPVLVYERSGGFAGRVESWSIYASGRVTDHTGAEWQVPQAHVAQLMERLEAAGFLELDGEYLPPDTCCDRFFHTLSLHLPAGSRTVTTIDDAGNAPDALWQAIDLVSHFVDATGQTASASPEADAPTEDAPEKAAAEVTPIPGSEAQVTRAREMLADLMGLPVESIKLAAVEAVEWRDSSLGCPREGFMYTQVVTPGYRILLTAGESTYDMHTDSRATVMLCLVDGQPPNVETMSADDVSADTAPAPETRGEAASRLGDAVILYSRSGGIAGIEEVWRIYADGRTEAEDGRSGQLAPDQVMALQNDIRALGFFDLAASYIPLDTCCDRFTYVLVMRDGDALHQVSTLDAAPDAPPALQEMLGLINTAVTGAD